MFKIFATLAIVLILLIVALILYGVAQNRRMVREGGMRKKYAELISYFMALDPSAKIVNEKKASLVIAIKRGGEVTMFGIAQSFRKVTIYWQVKSPQYGEYGHFWRFAEQRNQYEVIDEIEKEIKLISQKKRGKQD